jgi:hypothetical protein
MFAEMIKMVSFEIGIVELVKSLKNMNEDEKSLVLQLQVQNAANILLMNEKWMNYLRETFENFSESVLRFTELSSLYKDYIDHKIAFDKNKIGHRNEIEIDLRVRESRTKMKAAFFRMEMLFKTDDLKISKIRQKVEDIKQSTQNRPKNWEKHCEKHLEAIKELIIKELEKTWLRISRYNQFSSLVLSGDKEILKKVDNILSYAANKIENEQDD